MERCKFAFNVQYYLDENGFVTVAFSFNKAKILTVIARGNSSFNGGIERKKDRGGEWRGQETAGIGYIFRSGANLASHRNRVSEGRVVVFFHPPPTLEPDQITFLFCFHRDTRLSATIDTYFRDPPVIPAPSLRLVEKRTILPFQFPSTYFLSRTFFHFPLFFVLSRAKCKYLFFFPQGKSTWAQRFRLFFNFRSVLNFVQTFSTTIARLYGETFKKYIYIRRNIFFPQESYFLFIPLLYTLSRSVMMCLYRIELFTSCLQITKVIDRAQL